MSSQSLTTDRTIRAFVPTKLELIALPTFSLIFLTLSNGLQLIRNIDDENYQQIIDYMETQVKSLLEIVDRLIGSTAPLILFWMFIGVVAYILLWLGIGVYNTYKGDLPEEKGMIVPADYNHSRVLRSSIVHLLTRGIAAGLLIVWLYMLFAEVLPYCGELFLTGMERVSLATLTHIVLATLILSAWLFTISILSRSVMLRDRVFA